MNQLGDSMKKIKLITFKKKKKEFKSSKYQPEEENLGIWDVFLVMKISPPISKTLKH